MGPPGCGILRSQVTMHNSNFRDKRRDTNIPVGAGKYQGNPAFTARNSERPLGGSQITTPAPPNVDPQILHEIPN